MWVGMCKKSEFKGVKIEQKGALKPKQSRGYPVPDTKSWGILVDEGIMANGHHYMLRYLREKLHNLSAAAPDVKYCGCSES